MKTSDLIFIGIKGSVLALNRQTGEQVWATHLTGSDFANVVIEEGKIFAATSGEIYCLDPVGGLGLWHNELKGFGTGLATIATQKDIGNGVPTVIAEKQRRDEEAAASATVTTL